jgi:RNA polymerase-associated protein RTF1
MSDIDDELLALAGDASSDEEEEAPMNISGESSASPDRKVASKAGPKKSGRKAGRRQNDSEEEGEA